MKYLIAIILDYCKINIIYIILYVSNITPVYFDYELWGQI